MVTTIAVGMDNKGFIDHLNLNDRSRFREYTGNSSDRKRYRINSRGQGRSAGKGKHAGIKTKAESITACSQRSDVEGIGMVTYVSQHTQTMQGISLYEVAILVKPLGMLITTATGK